MNTCLIRNGTYGCMRTPGHHGRHLTAVSPQGRRYAFTDSYSAMMAPTNREVRDADESAASYLKGYQDVYASRGPRTIDVANPDSYYAGFYAAQAEIAAARALVEVGTAV